AAVRGWQAGQPRGRLVAVTGRAPRLAWREHAELVAFRVGQHHPGDVTLAEVGRGGTKRPQAGHLGGVVVAEGRCDVQVEAGPRPPWVGEPDGVEGRAACRTGA